MEPLTDTLFYLSGLTQKADGDNGKIRTVLHFLCSLQC